PLQAAIAVSVPFDLADCARRLNRGFSRLYQWYLLRHLRAGFRAKFSRIPCPLRVDVERLRSFREYDDQVTAPLHGFSGADEYYARSSCGQYLRDIATPTLILHARDDPFMYPEDVPGEEALADAVTLELSAHGGHAGFVAGRSGLPHYWLEERISRWLRQRLPGPDQEAGRARLPP
ncbi:MAG: hydrolase, partial [Gammaproteobacteria bacterium]